MSLDRSLKIQTGLTRSRSVLTRAERLKVLADEERWTDSKSVFGLPKVRQRKSTLGKKVKEAAAEGAAAPAAAAPAAKGGAAKGAAAPAAAGAKAAPGAKAAAPKGGAAAPAAKGAAKGK
jgi:small basic protein (TIGR04137 family)